MTIDYSVSHPCTFVEGQVLLGTWLLWQGYVLSVQKNDVAWLTTDDGYDVGDSLEGPVLSDWGAIDARSWHERYGDAHA